VRISGQRLSALSVSNCSKYVGIVGLDRLLCVADDVDKTVIM